jgi:large subunit ribosomal protein L17
LTPERPLAGRGLGIGRTVPAIAPQALAALGDTTEATLPADGANAVPAPAPDTTAAAAAIPAGAIRGDGTATCPPGFPVKGNAQSKIFHTVESRSYAQTIAEFCFSTPEAAHAAGYRPPLNL